MRSISPEIQQPNIVVIGGGNGTSTILKGLKELCVSATAIVNTFDDGGSTGLLRRDYTGLIGLGDARQCLSILAEDRELAEKFNTRCEQGHAFGNIALVETAIRLGGVQYIDQAIKIWSKKLSLAGEVIPVSLDPADVELVFPDGSSITGEFEIAYFNRSIRRNLGRLTLEPHAAVSHEAETKIKDSNVIVLAPGNFYGSVIPPLLTQGCLQAIAESNSPVIMIKNLISENSTSGFNTNDYIDELTRLTDVTPDIIVVQKFSNEISTRCEQIVCNAVDYAEPHYESNDKIANRRSKIRHNGKMLGSLILDQIAKP